MPKKITLSLALLIIAVSGVVFYKQSGHVPNVEKTNFEASYFSELIAQNGGEIPFPIETLVRDMFKKVQIIDEEQVQIILIPNGRSVQRNTTDFKDPRILIGLGWRYPILIGYSPKAEQLEIISFNTHTSEYDFHIVKDYKKDGRPKIETPDRNLCLQCHQHGGPIFSRAPWREIREPIVKFRDRHENFVAKAIVDERKKAGEDAKNYHGLDLEAYSSEKKDFYIGDFKRGPAASFNFYVRAANKLLQRRHVIQHVCEKDLECRSRILKMALIVSSLNYNVETSRQANVKSLIDGYIVYLQNILKKHWPADEFAFISPVLPDRQVLNAKGNVGFIIRPLLQGKDLTYDEFLGDFMPDEFKENVADDNKTFFGKASPRSFKEVKTTDQEILDPKTPRPQIEAIPVEKAGEYAFNYAFIGLNFAARDRELLMAMDPHKLAAVLSHGKKYKDMVGVWPPDTNAVMAAVLTDMNMPKEAQMYLSDIKNKSRPQVTQTEYTYAVRKQTTGKLLDKYCASCHQSDSQDGGYLPLENLKQLTRTKHICTDIARKKMPPQSKNVLQPNAQEITEMLKVLDCTE